MITHTSPEQLLEWWQDRRTETRSRRLAQQEYSARCRSYDLGVQWISRGSGGTALDSHAIRLYKAAGNANVPGGGPQPLRTTLNEITKNIRQSQASSAPAKLDVHSTPCPGIGRPSDIVEGDICEAIANSTVEDSNLLSAARRTNFERTIDGMHGFGYTIERSVRNGRPDMRLQSFNFAGHQLTLDPTNLNTNLYGHEYVGLTEVMSVHAAARRYGDDQIQKLDTSALRDVGNLSPIESKFYALTGGQLFPEMAHTSKAKGLLVHTIFLRGPSKRFDRMYVILDTGAPNSGNNNRDSRMVVNWDQNQQPEGGNPYGGIGLPLFCLYGYPRPGDINGVSDVAMMIDAQDKLNIVASIYFQSYWNHVSKLLFVDRGALEDSKMSASDVMRQVRQGIMFVKIRDRNTQMPQFANMPQPPGQVGMDIERFKDSVRDANFRSAAHNGEVKTHVSSGAQSQAIERAEISLEDRVDQDIREYEKCIESMTCTQIRLAQAGAPSAIKLLIEAGLSDEQLGMMLRIDPMRQLPRLKVSEESIRRRSRNQRKNDIVNLMSAGVFANDPDEVRRLYAALDMPLSENDTSFRQFAEVAAAKIAMGEPYKHFVMGRNAQYLLEALQRVATQVTDPEARDRVTQAQMLQRQIESEAAQVGQPTQGGVQQQAQQPQEPSLQQLLDSAFQQA